jgi:hypothetical protein
MVTSSEKAELVVDPVSLTKEDLKEYLKYAMKTIVTDHQTFCEDIFCLLAIAKANDQVLMPEIRDLDAILGEVRFFI